MTPSLFNRICAHPVTISWVIGACVLNALMLTLLSNGVRLAEIASDSEGFLLLVLAVFATTLLGFCLGMLTCWPLVRSVCSKFNRDPLRIGDHVLILSGPHRGTAAEVYEIVTGQGGWDLARLNLGQEPIEKFTDIYEEYSVLKIKGERDPAPDSRPPSQMLTPPEVQTPDSQRTPFSGGCG